MTTPENRLFEKYCKTIQTLLDDGMPLEEIQARMAKYQDLDMNHQANIMNTMAKYRKTGDLAPLTN
jgi:DNA-binding transcriptional MerR regulator